MNTSQYRESAQIIPFPVRPHRASPRREEPRAAAVEQPIPGVAKVSYDSGWYHEAAIEEAIRTAKR